MFFTFFKIFTTPIHGAGDKHRHTEARQFFNFYLFKHVGGFSSGGGVRRRREVVFCLLFLFWFQRPPRRCAPPLHRRGTFPMRLMFKQSNYPRPQCIAAAAPRDDDGGTHTATHQPLTTVIAFFIEKHK